MILLGFFSVNDNTNHNLSIVHLNVQGIKSKIDQLELLTNESPIDICCFSETFLKSHEVDVLQFEGYQKAAHFCRQNTSRGGVCIYVKHSLTYRKLQWISDMAIERHFECCGIEITDLNYVVVCMYRTPDSSINLFIQYLETLLHKLTLRTRATKNKVIILGDFNINLLVKDKKTDLFNNTLQIFNMHPTITEATRITENSKTCIDNILTNFTRYKTEVLNLGISDHTAQIIRVYSSLSFQEKYWFTHKRKVDLHLDIFLKYLSQANFSNIYTYDNANRAYAEFMDLYCFIFNLCIPIERVKVSYKKKANWKTKGIKIASKNKRKMYLKYQLIKNNKNYVSYKKYSKLFKKVVRTSKKIGNIRYINRSTNKNKATWGVIKGHSSQHNNIKTSFERIKLGTEELVDPTKIASTLNKYFISRNEANQVRNSTKLNDHNTNCKSIFINPVTSQELINIVKQLNNKKTAGFDGVSVQVIKSSLKYIIEPLVYIVNLSIETGIFPDDLKKALIKPVHKKGSKLEMENYRPIAILPSFSKIFEKVLLNRITSFLDANKILNNHQFGFRKGKNTTLAIFKMLKQVWDGINDKKTGIAVFLDLSMAFDCVSHEILLRKLEAVGIRGTSLSLIKSYLSNRYQATIIDVYNKDTKTLEQVQSVFEEIHIGVPQGSILGPLLFILYINELPNIIQHLCVMFADDATIFIPQNNLSISDFEKEVNETINKVTNWLEFINLKVNIKKTNILQFKSYKTEPLELNIINKGNKVKEINVTNFLGITIDCHLNWKAHINNINNKITKYCYALSIIRGAASKSVAISTYYGYVYPQLSYGIIFWGDSVNIQSTFILQKRCLRSIYNLEDTESLRDIFKTNKFLTLTGLYILELCLFVKNNEDTYYNLQSNRTCNLRSKYKNNICMPQINNTMYYKSCYINGIKIFNQLPCHIKTLCGNKFKQTLKEWLLAKAYYSVKEYYDII